MSESMPFVCKWLDSHYKPQYFKTVEELRKHVAKHDINSCNKTLPGTHTYICPWKGCKKSHNSNIMLEGIKKFVNCFFGFASSTDTIEIIILYLTEHLRRHIQQRPFKVDSENYFIRYIAL